MLLRPPLQVTDSLRRTVRSLATMCVSITIICPFKSLALTKPCFPHSEIRHYCHDRGRSSPCHAVGTCRCVSSLPALSSRLTEDLRLALQVVCPTSRRPCRLLTTRTPLSRSRDLVRTPRRPSRSSRRSRASKSPTEPSCSASWAPSTGDSSLASSAGRTDTLGASLLSPSICSIPQAARLTKDCFPCCLCLLSGSRSESYLLRTPGRRSTCSTRRRRLSLSGLGSSLRGVSTDGPVPTAGVRSFLPYSFFPPSLP